MAQFQIPQFIETEDKIIGPLTLKQFLYLAAAAAISFLAFFTLNTFLWLMITIFVGVIGAAFAFVKYNGRPLAIVLIAAFKHLWRPRMYLWQREEAKAPQNLPAYKISVISPKKIPIKIPLKNLWLKLTTSSQATPKAPAIKQIEKEKFETFKKITGEKDIARRIDYR